MASRFHAAPIPGPRLGGAGAAGWLTPLALGAAALLWAAALVGGGDEGLVLVAMAGTIAAGLPLFWRPRASRSSESRPAGEATGPPQGDGDERPQAGCFVYSAESLHEAHLVLDLLREAGIGARLFNEHLLGAMGELPFYQSLPRIWLFDEADRDSARVVIEGYEARRKRSTDETRHCDACGEDSPECFELCWSCRAPFDAE